MFGVRNNCGETEVHLELKNMVVEAVHSHGWAAQTEVTGQAPHGEQWRADVLAQKGNARVAVEIQWSGQTNDETLRRQERYKQCGIRGLWLLRQPGFPVAHSLPAICVGGNLHDGFEALIPYCWAARMNARDRADHRHNQVMPLGEFLDAAFGGIETDAISTQSAGREVYCISTLQYIGPQLVQSPLPVYSRFPS
jgi:hypothetical protein